MADRHGLEQTAHGDGLGEALGGVDEGGGAGGRLGAGETVGTLEQAEPGEEDALRDGAVDGGAEAGD